MDPENLQPEKIEPVQTKNRKPIYYGASGCVLGFLIMVGFVALIALIRPGLTISGDNFQTIINLGSWLLPIGLGVLGYFYGKKKQK